jgi:hypothetical protein
MPPSGFWPTAAGSTYVSEPRATCRRTTNLIAAASATNGAAALSILTVRYAQLSNWLCLGLRSEPTGTRVHSVVARGCRPTSQENASIGIFQVCVGMIRWRVVRRVLSLAFPQLPQTRVRNPEDFQMQCTASQTGLLELRGKSDLSHLRGAVGDGRPGIPRILVHLFLWSQLVKLIS